MTEIQQFYTDQSIFITGGTGFLGTLLIEKLLRSCPKLKTIYILARQKKGKQIQDRVKEMTNLQIFEPLRAIDPNFEKKLVPMSGDLMKPNFKLSDKDLKIIQKEVSIVFHVAATTRFDELLKIALQVNVDSVKTMLDICKECKKLKAFVYVSTAFSNCIYEHIEEKVYPAPMSHEDLTNLVGVMDELNMSEEEEIEFTNLIIGKYPNTYCFSKSIAENVVSKYAKELPVSVYRFSIALAALKEPLEGWLDPKQAITQTLIRIGLGIIRVIYVNSNATMETVPIDFACNCLIASAWDTSSCKKNKQERMQVYNYVSGRDNPVTWSYLRSYLRTHRYTLALKKTFYYPDTLFIKSLYLFFIFHYILHFIPAILGDVFLIVLGRKPMLYEVFKKGTKLVWVISFFTNGEWIFDTDNVKSLWKKLSENDKKLFNFDITSFTWDVMIRTNSYGIKKFLMDKNIDADVQKRTMRKIKRLFYVHQVVRGTFYASVLWLCWKIYSLLFNRL
ncbi:fatty acyl-CoA reductase wat-like [Leptopilina heterotoma]|uniref:fatty acyl-CoA reductase wat-like n=1 Tax=Leptopilina heterotoma TaxID=63436 RepID=UPI001CA8B8CB|nr:fatty acyl-CoA reductase wat-like [Leptopilina heterotoma]